MSDIWFISDTHFSHKNIIPYENRPFVSTDHMDGVLVDLWNSVVKPNDIVWHLGDVFFCGSERSKKIGNMLNGRKRLRLGNHDRKTVTHYKECGFEEVYSKDVVNTDLFGIPVLLSHYPYPSQEIINAFGLKNIHGHTHSQIEGLDQNTYKCVSVELIDYTPIHIDELREWVSWQ